MSPATDVWCPHVTIHPDTRAALDEYAPGWVGHELDPADMTAYSRWMVDRWADGIDLTIVEHDIVIHEGVLPGFADCPDPWCLYPYSGPARQVLAQSLGCVRFRAGLLTAIPLAVKASSAVNDSGDLPPGDWRRLDIRLAGVLRGNGYTPHVHEPMVGHRHHYIEEACGCGCETS